jgi:hypothetical protein
MSQPSLKEFSIERFLSAAECNAQSEISLPLLAQRLIEVSTAHANALNIGYDRLTPDGNAWVLSRMNIKIDRMPAINRNYRMITWLESLNRHFSERNVEIQDADGSTIGYARLIWNRDLRQAVPNRQKPTPTLNYRARRLHNISI